MKRAPVFRLWMNSRVGKSMVRSVISRSSACPAIMPSMPMARARSRASPERTEARGPPASPRPGSRRRGSGARRRPGSRWPRRGPRGRWAGRAGSCASSMEGRSSRIRLAVCTISMAQAAGSTLSGSPRRTSATSRARMGRRRLPGAKRLLDRGLHRGARRPAPSSAAASPPPAGDAAGASLRGRRSRRR